jgi:hypothetical protein
MTGNIDSLVAEIEAEYGIVAERIGKDKPDPRVLAALREVPRAEFVPTDRRADAYANRPLPIGFGQTISQPFIVAVMSDILALTPDNRVLEIGTGCGYQTAFLARLAGRVYTAQAWRPDGGAHGRLHAGARAGAGDQGRERTHREAEPVPGRLRAAGEGAPRLILVHHVTEPDERTA